MSTQYVQHNSGTGAKWPVSADLNRWAWEVYASDGAKVVMQVPKSEYRLCEPPERWVDVTAWCVEHGTFIRYRETTIGSLPDGYRLRKIPVFHSRPEDSTWAFIVEKREP